MALEGIGVGPFDIKSKGLSVTMFSLLQATLKVIDKVYMMDLSSSGYFPLYYLQMAKSIGSQGISRVVQHSYLRRIT